ncbi:hypothetical protein BU23DRAFT_642837 [Bimuria novae-zelandiae CBS 107.79]|uniref:C2H2-type domain-containing protein n=1 Tax=Bimuria novae-zelandiae CBS 107.79 TaxID=1447943 RepID=A0A6A5VWT7_9PLEO|nr:hypothetical protein BU23DRAFT_642837 [Bimuria novae-zelandiae CBS 107.79]
MTVDTHAHSLWDLPGLREHVIGKSKSGIRNGPHILHECENCLEVFLEKSDLDHHEKAYRCTRQDFYPLPAEGVGKRLSREIPELPQGPKSRGPQYEALWKRWYIVVNGDDPLPQACCKTLSVSPPLTLLTALDFDKFVACCNDLFFSRTLQEATSIDVFAPFANGPEGKGA